MCPTMLATGFVIRGPVSYRDHPIQILTAPLTEFDRVRCNSLRIGVLALESPFYLLDDVLRKGTKKKKQ